MTAVCVDIIAEYMRDPAAMVRSDIEAGLPADVILDRCPTVHGIVALYLLHEADMLDKSTTPPDVLIADRYVQSQACSAYADHWAELIGYYGMAMTGKEIRMLSRLQERWLPVKAYRGYCAETGVPDGLSWTLSRRIAHNFACGTRHEASNPAPAIATVWLDATDIFAIKLDRYEAELIVPSRPEPDEVILMPEHARTPYPYQTEIKWKQFEATWS